MGRITGTSVELLSSQTTPHYGMTVRRPRRKTEESDTAKDSASTEIPQAPTAEELKVDDVTDKVMIGVDRMAVNRKIADARELCRLAEKLAPLYDQLGIGEFDLSALHDAIAEKGARAKALYLDKIAEVHGKEPSVLRHLATDHASRWTNPYALAVSRLRNDPHDAELCRYITIENGRFVVTREDANRVERDCAKWLSDPREIAKYNLHRQIIAQLNEFFGNVHDIPPFWFNWFIVDNSGKFVLSDTGANYSVLVK